MVSRPMLRCIIFRYPCSLVGEHSLVLLGGANTTQTSARNLKYPCLYCESLPMYVWLYPSPTMAPLPLKYKVLFPWTVPNLRIALGRNGDLLSSGLECEFAIFGPYDINRVQSSRLPSPNNKILAERTSPTRLSCLSCSSRRCCLLSYL